MGFDAAKMPQTVCPRLLEPGFKPLVLKTCLCVTSALGSPYGDVSAGNYYTQVMVAVHLLTNLLVILEEKGNPFVFLLEFFIHGGDVRALLKINKVTYWTGRVSIEDREK